MSIQAISWAYGVRGISTGAKFLLVTLANYSDHRGISWPGQDRLSRDTCSTKRSVIRWAQELEEAGLVKVEKREGDGRGRRTNVYTLSTRQSDSLSPIKSKKRVKSGGQSDIHDRQSDTVSPKPKEEPKDNTKRGTTKTERKWELPETIDRQAWEEFEQYRKEIKKPLTDQMRTKNANVLVNYSHEQQKQIVDTTIAQGWRGLFPLKGVTNERRESRSEKAARIWRERNPETVSGDEGELRSGVSRDSGRGGGAGSVGEVLEGEYRREKPGNGD